jgi:hypothetical protein
LSFLQQLASLVPRKKEKHIPNSILTQFLFLILLGGFWIQSTNIVNSAITTPLYTVDYKSQVIFGDSITVGGYYGLENYVAEYVGGYLRITYTTTHKTGTYANYPPILYVRSDDPSQFSNTTSLYQGLAKKINDASLLPTDYYLVDIQFSTTGYREIVTSGASSTPVSDDTVLISNMNEDTFVALANQYALQNPPVAYSMSFAPMRLVEFAPTKILSFDISTSTRMATIHSFISPNDIGVGINLNIGSVTQPNIYTAETFYATTSGDFYYIWNYPAVTDLKTTQSNNYTFSTNITKDGVMLRSTSKVLSLASPPSSPCSPLVREPAMKRRSKSKSSAVKTSSFKASSHRIVKVVPERPGAWSSSTDSPRGT